VGAEGADESRTAAEGACRRSGVSSDHDRLDGEGVVLLFDGFETLDAFGPVEVLQTAQITRGIRLWSLSGGIVTSTQGVPVLTEKVPAEIGPLSYVLVPGGRGVRPLVGDDAFLARLRELAEASTYLLTVCTGSGLAAAAGILDGRRATSNKRTFEWVRTLGPAVAWVPRARWAVDGRIYTSSGVSAGIDMAFAFVRDIAGEECVREVEKTMEYVWGSDPDDDPFAPSPTAASA
jgi:transcriptional regulator GlxA family with amidase domain